MSQDKTSPVPRVNGDSRILSSVHDLQKHDNNNSNLNKDSLTRLEEIVYGMELDVLRREAEEVKRQQERESKIREMHHVKQQYLKCSYNSLIFDFLELLNEKKVQEIQKEYGDSIQLLQRLGIRVCDVLEQSYQEDEDQPKNINAPNGEDIDILDIILIAVKKDLSVLTPSKNFIKQLEKFHRDVLVPTQHRLLVTQNHETKKLDIILRGVYEKSQSLDYKTVQIPIEYDRMEERLVTDLLPKFHYIQITLDMLHMLCETYIQAQQDFRGLIFLKTGQ